MKRALTALALAGTVAIATIATPTSAHAQWRRGWGWGVGWLGARPLGSPRYRLMRACLKD